MQYPHTDGVPRSRVCCRSVFPRKRKKRSQLSWDSPSLCVRRWVSFSNGRYEDHSWSHWPTGGRDLFFLVMAMSWFERTGQRLITLISCNFMEDFQSSELKGAEFRTDGKRLGNDSGSYRCCIFWKLRLTFPGAVGDFLYEFDISVSGMDLFSFTGGLEILIVQLY